MKRFATRSFTARGHGGASAFANCSETKEGLPPNYLSAGLAAIQVQVEAGREWFKERQKLPKRLHPSYRLRSNSRATLSKECIEAACLRRELSQQFESALVIGDDDWLNELAKAIRGEAQPEPSAELISKVLDLLQRKAGATATYIFGHLEVTKLDDGRLKVEEHIFENKQRVLDAINDISAKVHWFNVEWKRIVPPLRYE